MKSKSLITGTAFAAVSLLSLLVLSGGGAQGAFGSNDSNPVAKMDEVHRLTDTQKVLRAIHDQYMDRVAFITTEHNIKIPDNPFGDEFFSPFFGNPREGNRNGNSRNGQGRTQKKMGLGSGFVISEDGYVATNHHVVAGADKVKVKIKGKEYLADVIGSDDRTDIALIKISSSEKFKPVYFGNSDDVRSGDWAIAIGNPFGLANTFTVGFVSATGRKDVEMLGGFQSFIQTDAPINPGNSGGPLINIRGEVIGVNSAIISQSGGNVGIGFAVPVNIAKTILEQLRVNKKIKRGYIGIYPVPLGEEYARKSGLFNSRGALVEQVVPDGPAQKAGMKVGDIILKIDERKIETANELVEVAGNLSIGKTVKILVWRDKSEITLNVTTKERP